MPSRRLLCLQLCLVGATILCLRGPEAQALDERSTHLLELSIAYGDSHFSSATNMVLDAAGRPNGPDYSLPYAMALLETGISTSRAKAVVVATVTTQDVDQRSATRGMFKVCAIPDAPYSLGATDRLAPLLALAATRHAAKLGDDITQQVRAAAELAAFALKRQLPKAKDIDRTLEIAAALAAVEQSLGGTTDASVALRALARWERNIVTSGRTWAPSPGRDAARLLALQRLWEAVPVAQRAIVDRLLRLCYLDFAQRIHPKTSVPAGAATAASPGEYLEARSLASYLIYRDFGGPLPPGVDPRAATVALVAYRPASDVVVLGQGGLMPRTVETNSDAELVPAKTVTYLTPGYTLGTMTGWCLPESLPIFASFASNEKRPTAYFHVHGGPAHVSSLQYGNMAICSFNFDRIGGQKRKRAWLRGSLCNVHDAEEIYAMGGDWNGEPIAIGTRETVVVKRKDAYLAVTVLERGPADTAPTSRRLPGVLEWQGIGENAELTLTVYARYEDYPLRRWIDDVRAGVVVQIWAANRFESAGDLARWLGRCKLNQRYARAVKSIVQERDIHPVLDQHKPQPRAPRIRRSQKLHTIEYSYERGRGDGFRLVEDLKHEEVISRAMFRNPSGGKLTADTPLRPVGSGLWWKTPAFTLAPGQPLAEALAPAKPPEAG